MKIFYLSRRCSSRYCFTRRLYSFVANAKLETLPDVLHPVSFDTKSTDEIITLHETLKSCLLEPSPLEAKGFHPKIIRMGLITDTVTSNILINMYSKSGLIMDSRKLFDEMPQRSLVSWNTMIGAYTQLGDEQEGLLLFKKLVKEGFSTTRFSEFTMSSVICACAAKFAVFECRQLHGFSLKVGLDFDVFVGTALVDVYAKCGLIKDAGLVFEYMEGKNEVSWSSMVAGYVQNQMYEEALVFFRRCQVVGRGNSHFMASSVIFACAELAVLIEGKQVHGVVLKNGFDSNIFVASSLVDMYSRCGNIKDAYIVFSEVENKNVVSMNAMISGFAKHNRISEAMILFEKMQQMGICPSEVTYVSVLSACSHAGLVEKGRKYFHLMAEEHNVSPNIFHYSCMVDILGRAGLINEACDLIAQMPFDATASIWGSILASCRIHGNLPVAEAAAKKLFEIEPANAGNHVLLSQLYAAKRKWEEVARARKGLRESEAKTEKGKSWIEIKDRVHSFMVGERNHPRISDINMKLHDLLEEMKKLGYTIGTEHDHHDVEEREKLELLRHHSEKLALAFGLMCLPINIPIRIMKNLRICTDCHSFMKVASTIARREIIVRDNSRFHHFSKGSCSCGDFW